MVMVMSLNFVVDHRQRQIHEDERWVGRSCRILQPEIRFVPLSIHQGYTFKFKLCLETGKNNANKGSLALPRGSSTA